MEQQQLVDPILLSNFIHQIINPLNGVVGTIENLIDGTVKGEDRQQQRLQAVKAQLSNSIEMIRNLAFLSQLQSSEGIESLRSKSAPINVITLIIEALQFFQEIAKKRGISIEIADKKTQYIIHGHRHLFRQLLLNILDNCIKYSKDNSNITINTRVQKKTNQFILEIINYGIGFDYDEKEKIFNLGYRSKKAQDERASGSGIGLYICKRVAELVHEGQIEAEHSDSEQKTTMRIKFPEFKYGESRR